MTSRLCRHLTRLTLAAATGGQPNILWIMSNDHAAHAIGAYGGRLAVPNPAPTLDQLACKGTRFANVFCANSIFTPSRPPHRPILACQRRPQA